jgi:hypothetical protein
MCENPGSKANLAERKLPGSRGQAERAERFEEAQKKILEKYTETQRRLAESEG